MRFLDLKFCYNENYACRMRGTESDVPNAVDSVRVGDEAEAVEYIIFEVFGIDADEWVSDENGYGNNLTIKDLIDYANEIDITGGDPVLFWVELDGVRSETMWAGSEKEWEFDESEKKSNKIKESNMPRGNGGWPYDERDVVWDDDDEVLVSLSFSAYPKFVQDEIMSSNPGDPELKLSPEAELRLEQFDTSFVNMCKSHGGYEFIYDGDGESGPMEPRETGLFCMTYKNFLDMCKDTHVGQENFDVELKSSWY